MKTNLIGLACAALLPLAACGGDDSTSKTTPQDLAVANTTGGDLAQSSFLVVESCAQSDYVDARTDATKRVVTPWDTTLGKLCIHITAGQSVTWMGVPNPSHPLEAHDTASTAGNPITNVSVNTFPNAGTFGYDCEVHHTLMHGAILVDPS